MQRCLYLYVIVDDSTLEKASELFSALSAPSRLRILCALSGGPSTVGALVRTTALSQPLISQQLRLLRALDLVTVARSGREAWYSLADDHVTHVIRDAISHSREPGSSPLPQPSQREKDMTEEVHAEHTVAEHQHGGADCTHESVEHEGHLDYLHDGHRHAEHGDHYDEH